MRSIKLVSVEPTDYTAEIFEVRQKKHVIHDAVPVQCGAMILATAKLHFVRFLKDLVNNLDCSALRVVYMGKSERPRGVRAKLVPSAGVPQRREAAWPRW